MARDDDNGGLRSITFHEEGPRPHRRKRKRKTSRTRKAVLILLVLLLALGGGLAVGGFILSEKLGSQVTRIPHAFDIPEQGRPKKPTSGAGADAVNILLAGSDRRTSGQTTGKGNGDAWKQGGQRTDTIMVLHITGDRKSASLISIPRDSWVTIPGHGKNKINAAYAYGGPKLYVQTVENVTGLRIDHLAVIDWDGFKALTDALGGVRLTFDKPVQGVSGTVYPAGTHTLTGAEALDYVRERHSLPNGDFGRVERQQNFLRTLMHQTLSNGTLSHPLKLTKVLNAVTNNLSVDESFSTGEMRKLAIQMRHLRSSGVTFMTVPTDGTGTEGSQSVVYLDDSADSELWDAVKNGTLQSWIATYGHQDVLGHDVN